MKKFGVFCLASITVMLLTGAGFGEQSTSKDRKQQTNFWGTLTKNTGQKKEYHVDNISIANLTKQIAVFEVPTQAAGTLANDPRNGTRIRLDLNEIAKIEVPNPDTKWSYKRNDRAQVVEYIEFVVTPRCNGRPNHYLIDLNRRLFCDEKSAGGPIEMDIPFNEIKELVIEGFNARTEQDSKPACEIAPTTPNDSRNNSTDSRPCPVNTVAAPVETENAPQKSNGV